MNILRMLIEEARGVLREMTRTQRVSVFALVMTVGALLLAAFVIGGTSETRGMIDLPMEVGPGDAKDVIARLKEEGYEPVQYDLESKRVRVPLDQSRDAVIFLASQDLLATDEAPGFVAMLDKWGFSDTRNKTDQMLLVARANEISRLVESIDVVKTAKVVYSDSGKASLFRPLQKQMAAVRVETKLGKDLDRKTANTIISLVAAAKAGLAEKDVVVSDQTGRKFRARGPNDLGGIAEDKFLMEKRLSDDLQEKIEANLRDLVPNVGFGGSVSAFVTTKVNYDNYSSETINILEGVLGHDDQEKREFQSTDKPAAPVGLEPNVGRAANVGASAQGNVKTARESRSRKIRDFENGRKREVLKRAPKVEDVTVSAVIHLPYERVPEEDGEGFVIATDRDGSPIYEQDGQPRWARRPSQPLPQARIQEIEQSIAHAAGIAIDDIPLKIKVVQYPWRAPVLPDPPPPAATLRVWNLIRDEFVPIVLALVLVVAVGLMYSQARAATESEELSLPPEEGLGMPDMSGSDMDESQANYEALRAKVADAVSEDPRKAANLIRRWMKRENY